MSNFKKMASSAALLLAFSGSVFSESEDCIQIGVEGKSHSLNMSVDGEDENGHHNLFGGALRYERNTNELFFGIDNRALIGKRNSDIRSASMFESKAFLGFSVIRDDNDRFLLMPYSGVGIKHSRFSTLEDGDSGKIANKILFIPVGLRSTFDMGEFLIKPSLEYDFMIKGSQRISGVLETKKIPCVMSHSLKGFGAKFNIEFDFGDFSLMPFVNFWKFKSNNSTISANGISITQEIKNRSRNTEVGIRVGVNF